MSRSFFAKYVLSATVILFLTVIYLLPRPGYPLMEPDEGRYSEIPREMRASGDYVTPRLNGVEYFEKPVLSYWLTAAAQKVFGENEFAGRFWPAVAALLGLAATAALAGAMYGFSTGLTSMLVTGTSLLYLGIGSINILDMPLSAFITWTMTAFWFGEHHKNRHWYLAAYVCMALGVLTKGLVAVLLPAGILFWYIICTKRWKLFRDYLYLPGFIVFFVLTVPWFAAVCWKNSDFFYFFFIQEHFLRYTTRMHERFEPFWYFVPMIIAGVFPWTGFLPGLFARDGVVRQPEGEDGRANVTFLLLWFGVILLFYSLSDSKLIPYVVPCIPPLGIMIASSLRRSVQLGKWLGGTLWTTTALSLIFSVGTVGYCVFGKAVAGNELIALAVTMSAPLTAGAVLALYAGTHQETRSAAVMLCFTAMCLSASLQGLFRVVADGRTALPVAKAIAAIRRPGDVVVNYKDYLQGLPFYLKTRVLLVDYRGELMFGSNHPRGQGWFISEDEFLKRWLYGEERLILAISRSRNEDPFSLTAAVNLDIGNYRILVNRP